MALWAVYWIFSKNPRIVPQFGDLRDVFGRDLKILNFVAFVPLILLVVRAFDVFAFDLVMSRRRKLSVPPLLRDLIAFVLYVVLFGSVLHELYPGYNPSTFLTGSAVVAAILGLAMQDTLGNLFAGIALHLEDSFEVGDVIKSGEHMGRVETVSWRATRIRTYNNEVVLLPNSMISRDRL